MPPDADDAVMVQAVAAEAPSRPPVDTRSRRSWRWAAVVTAALVVSAGVAWVLGANRDDTQSFATEQISRMHSGCQQWVDSTRTSGSSDAAWCTAMADWMNGQMGAHRSGRNGMMGSMMWRDPDAMRDACKTWMSTNPGEVPRRIDGSAWCGQMVDWMEQHMGDWGEWMKNGPQLG